ncbi:ANTAR domain-containing protein [Candidatus Roizmanbacteria bacterium]|nr:ANTAR domain-containing protein [Candidatus Roizmanbacteria bacterium]
MSKQHSLTEIIDLLSELVVFSSYDFQEFLNKLIKLIIKIIPIDSCLIYFYDRDRKELILVASKQPHDKLIGKIKLKWGEGVTGWVAEHRKTAILEKKAYQDKRFKYFKELPEDRYEAFLSVPIIDKEGVVGVINLQNKLPHEFKKDQIIIIEAVVKIVASAFEKVILERKVGNLKNKLDERKIIERAKGILMKEKNVDENSAYKMLRNEAMKTRKSLKDIAEVVVMAYKIN